MVGARIDALYTCAPFWETLVNLAYEECLLLALALPTAFVMPGRVVMPRDAAGCQPHHVSALAAYGARCGAAGFLPWLCTAFTETQRGTVLMHRMNEALGARGDVTLVCELRASPDAAIRAMVADIYWLMHGAAGANHVPLLAWCLSAPPRTESSGLGWDVDTLIRCIATAYDRGAPEALDTLTKHLLIQPTTTIACHFFRFPGCTCDYGTLLMRYLLQATGNLLVCTPAMVRCYAAAYVHLMGHCAQCTGSTTNSVIQHAAELAGHGNVPALRMLMTHVPPAWCWTTGTLCAAARADQDGVLRCYMEDERTRGSVVEARWATVFETALRSNACRVLDYLHDFAGVQGARIYTANDRLLFTTYLAHRHLSQ